MGDRKMDENMGLECPWLRDLRGSVVSSLWRRFTSIGQGQDFNLADSHAAAGIVLLEGEMSLLEGQREIEVFVQLGFVDADLDPRHFAAPPDVVADFQVVGEPG